MMFMRSSAVSSMTELTTTFAFRLLEQQFAYAKLITDILVPAPKAKAEAAPTASPIAITTDGTPDDVSVGQMAIADTPDVEEHAEQPARITAMAAQTPGLIVPTPAAVAAFAIESSAEVTAIETAAGDAFAAAPIAASAEPFATPPIATASVEPVATAPIAPVEPPKPITPPSPATVELRADEVKHVPTVRADEVVPPKTGPLTAHPAKTPTSSANARVKPSNSSGRGAQKRKR